MLVLGLVIHFPHCPCFRRDSCSGSNHEFACCMFRRGFPSEIFCRRSCPSRMEFASGGANDAAADIAAVENLFDESLAAEIFAGESMVVESLVVASRVVGNWIVADIDETEVGSSAALELEIAGAWVADIELAFVKILVH